MNARLEKEILNEQIKTDNAVFVELSTEAIVIVGSGPVGMQLVNELSVCKVGFPIIVYGKEPVEPYNRVRLSEYLAGELSRDALTIEKCSDESTVIEYRYNYAVESIDKKAKTITDSSGRVQRYAKLVIATGSTPFVPKLDNLHYEGVYTFRTLGEADELMSRKIRTRHTVVIGGGLLGLETARAMNNYRTEITVIEHNKWLMMQQLNEDAAKYLADFVKKQNIRIITDDSVTGVTGSHRVEGVTLRSGIHLSCDTLIVAAGVRANTSLALDAGLSCGRGIRIDDNLETSEKEIYAIGECAEHRGFIYGLVKPGFEQAAVLANRITGGDANYIGSVCATQLKIISQSVFSAGRTGVDEESRTTVSEYVFSDKKAGLYRKIRVFGNRIIGAMAIGEWHESTLVNEAIVQKRKVWFWHILRFKQTGFIWGNADDVSVSTWPATAMVCNCNSVSRGRLSKAISDGCKSVSCLTNMTRAGSVCGSCKPLLAEMLGEQARAEPVRAWRGTLALSAMTLSLAIIIMFMWRVPYASSVQNEIRWDMLWRDSLFKQISGFTILGLSFIGLAVSLRKRLSTFTVGDYDLWRISHIVLGIASLVVLIAHTGFRFGNALNFLLMINFLLLATTGANTSTVLATEHRMVPPIAKKQRKLWNKIHLLLFWSLPVLLGFHVLKTYYF